MTQLSSIQTAWQLSLLLGAGMGVLLVLRWLWWRLNAWGELASIAASAVLAPILLTALSATIARRCGCCGWPAAATLAGIGASLATAPESARAPARLLPRARDRPASGAPSPPKRAPSRGATSAASPAASARSPSAALCVFCLLTGIGSWLAGSPAPPWLPARPVWIGLLIALGALLVPLWITLGRGTDIGGDAPEAARPPPAAD